MNFEKDIDYVRFYSAQLRENPKLFEQHKKFLEAQLIASQSLFSNWKGKQFKEKCRTYLKERGLIIGLTENCCNFKEVTKHKV